MAKFYTAFYKKVIFLKKDYKKIKILIAIFALFIILFSIIYFGEFWDFGNELEIIDNPETISENNEQNLTEQPPEIYNVISDEEWSGILSEILDAVNQLDASNFITRSGYLYSIQNSEFITISSLVSNGFLSQNFLEYEIYILYLSPDSFYNFSEYEFYISEEGASPQVFLAYSIIDGISLFSKNGYGFIFREDLNRILYRYNSNNGDIIHPSSNDSIFNLIPIESFENIRYIAYDNAHLIYAIYSESENIEFYVFDIYPDNINLIAQFSNNNENPIRLIHENNSFNFNPNLLPVSFPFDNPIIENDIYVSNIIQQIYDVYGIYNPIFYSSGIQFSYISFEFRNFLINRLDDSIIETQNWQDAKNIILETKENIENIVDIFILLPR